MFNNFELKICNIFKGAEKEKNELNHPFVGSEHLLLSLLKSDNNISVFCYKYDLTYDNFKKELIKVVGIPKKNNEIILYTPLLKRVIANALEDAKENNDGLVTTKHLLLAILEEGEGVAIRIMLGMDLDLDKMYDDLKKDSKEKNLEISYGKNLNESVSENEKVIGRDAEINFIIETLLRKKKNNPLLLGDAGVGKTAIVEELARKINKGDVPSELKNSIIVCLEMGNLVAGTKYRGEFEEKLTKIINELEKNDNIILFIDEIHSMVNAGGAEGAITAGDILKPYLARGKVKCIGATTTDEYNKYMASDKALARRFEIIKINEPNVKETINILTKIKGEYETHHHVKISNKEISNLVILADKYLPNRKNPDKSIDLLDSVCSVVKIQGEKNKNINKKYAELENIKQNKNECFLAKKYEEALKYKEKEITLVNYIKEIENKKEYSVCEKDIYTILEQKCHLPFLNKNKIINKINKELVNYPNLIKDLQSSLNNNKGLKLLFINSDKEIEKINKCFNNINYLKIDMNEFNYPSSLYKLIGLPNSNDNYIFQSIIYNPYSLLYIDNVLNASEEVLNIICHLLKNGYVTNSKNEKIDFNNTFIILNINLENTISLGFNKENKKNNECIPKLIKENVDDIIEFSKLLIP